MHLCHITSAQENWPVAGSATSVQTYYISMFKQNKYVIVFWWNMVPLHKNEQELLNVLLTTTSGREKATVRLSKTSLKPLSVI